MHRILLLLALLIAAGCAAPERIVADAPAPPPQMEPIPDPAALTPLQAMLAQIDSVTIRRHLEELSSDHYEGRGTGTRGEERTVAYIAEQMRAYGLTGGMPDGSFFQPVPLRGATPAEIGPLTITPTAGGEPVRLRFLDDFTASTDLDQGQVSVRGDLVFVGYGIEAPGFDWDDYKGEDVTGRILVMFVNDPPATPEEPALFQADTLTYYGRWTYKYEEARRRGALGAILIHTDEMAGYGFQVLTAGGRGEQIALDAPVENSLHFKGWVTQPVGEQLAALAGTTLETWQQQARSRDFRPQPIPATASIDMTFTARRFTGTNVIGKLEGRTRPHEAIVFTAHHDHLGMDEDLIAAGQDGIYSGAVDNASGVAMVLSAARAFGSMAERPDRTVLFITVSAEESGLLGSAYYAQNPVIPLAHTIANINLDAGNVWGPTEDIVGIGAERSDMMRLLQNAARAENMVVVPDPRPGQGIFFRSDQLSFARGGVPAVYVSGGTRYIGQPDDYYQQVRAEYAAAYHQPGDKFNPAWPMGGLIQQARVATRIAYHLATTTVRPQWREGEAFAGARAESEAAAGIR